MSVQNDNDGGGGQTFPLSTSSPMIRQAAVRMGFVKRSGVVPVGAEEAILERWREIWERRGNIRRGERKVSGGGVC